MPSGRKVCFVPWRCQGILPWTTWGVQEDGLHKKPKPLASAPPSRNMCRGRPSCSLRARHLLSAAIRQRPASRTDRVSELPTDLMHKSTFWSTWLVGVEIKLLLVDAHSLQQHSILHASYMQPHVSAWLTRDLKAHLSSTHIPCQSPYTPVLLRYPTHCSMSDVSFKCCRSRAWQFSTCGMDCNCGGHTQGCLNAICKAAGRQSPYSIV